MDKMEKKKIDEINQKLMELVKKESESRVKVADKPASTGAIRVIRRRKGAPDKLIF